MAQMLTLLVLTWLTRIQLIVQYWPVGSVKSQLTIRSLVTDTYCTFWSSFTKLLQSCWSAKTLWG